METSCQHLVARADVLLGEHAGGFCQSPRQNPKIVSFVEKSMSPLARVPREKV
jgi:hypothetical protein